MKLKKSFAAGALGAAALFGASAPAHAQFSGDVIRIGMITDMSSVYADLDGQAGVEAVRMAIADMGGNIAGKIVSPNFASGTINMPSCFRGTGQWRAGKKW